MSTNRKFLAAAGGITRRLPVLALAALGVAACAGSPTGFDPVSTGASAVRVPTPSPEQRAALEISGNRLAAAIFAVNPNAYVSPMAVLACLVRNFDAFTASEQLRLTRLLVDENAQQAMTKAAFTRAIGGDFDLTSLMTTNPESSNPDIDAGATFRGQNCASFNWTVRIAPNARSDIFQLSAVTTIVPYIFGEDNFRRYWNDPRYNISITLGNVSPLSMAQSMAQPGAFQRSSNEHIIKRDERRRDLGDNGRRDYNGTNNAACLRLPRANFSMDLSQVSGFPAITMSVRLGTEQVTERREECDAQRTGTAAVRVNGLPAVIGRVFGL